MSEARQIARVIDPQPVVEGAGVRLKRSIATRALDYLDPFLLLDHFDSKNPDDYRAGFPLHPHRGIETVTYMLSGLVRHKDTLGNSGTIGAGDVQWMTAGRGIMHEEMPQVRPEGVAGFQLWVNLPAKLKMTQPRYQEISAGQIPEIEAEGGAKIRVIAGTVGSVTGPVTGVAAEPTYLDVMLPPRSSLTQPLARGQTAFAYIFTGEAHFDTGPQGATIGQPKLIVWSDGDLIRVSSDSTAVRFLLVAAHPLREPIARYGPFVMNTREEIEQALNDLRRGTFV
jgi:redox-sensitive bicupin YhaK (pirin superfamily)